MILRHDVKARHRTRLGSEKTRLCAAFYLPKVPVMPRLGLLTLIIFALPTMALATCDFAAAKKEIDHVLDQDKEKSAAFRKQMAAGYDSLDVLGKMLPAPAREKVESCRFEAGEYLTKRGFPPAH
ncbi:MAG: hypothetical protein ACKVQK_28930 [Burkholderiales bacterium]